MPTTTINGFKHHYEDTGGSGDVLVMLHGANSSSRTLEEHFAELGQHFRVIAPDMRSMGQSEHVASLPKNAWVEDLVALLDHLGVQKAHVYGNSLGSRVGMRFAIDHPDRIRSLILSAPHTYLTEELNSGLNQAEGNGDNLPPAQQAEYARLHGEDWKNAYRNYYNIRNQPELQEYFNISVTNPMMQVIGKFSESVSSIKCPILVLQGDSFARGRGTFNHSIELKLELPDQVSLAIIPTWGEARMAPQTFRHVILQFASFVVAKEGLVTART